MRSETGAVIGAYVRSRGGILPHASLAAAGVRDLVLEKAVGSGELIRVRRGWYAVADANPDAVRAVAAGGRLTCGPALERFGVWCLSDKRLHIGLEPGARHSGIDARFHSARLTTPRGADPAVDSPLEALERLATCATRIGFLVAADSALNSGLIGLAQLERLLDRTTRGRRLLAAVDGDSESGIETIVRVALRRAGIELRSQVEIEGIGRVDLIVGDRLIIECDGYRWHSGREAFESDRHRDLQLSAIGYLVVRLTYRRVMEQWSDAEAELLAMIRRGDHRWQARHGRQLHVKRTPNLA